MIDYLLPNVVNRVKLQLRQPPNIFTGVAQRSEQGSHKPLVAGSIPAARTNFDYSSTIRVHGRRNGVIKPTTNFLCI